MHLIGPYSKTLGMISLQQKNSAQSSAYTQTLYRLRGIDEATHAVNKYIGSDVVLYNLNSVRNIHPVSDSNLFEKKNYDQWKFEELLYYHYVVNYVSNCTVF